MKLGSSDCILCLWELMKLCDAYGDTVHYRRSVGHGLGVQMRPLTICLVSDFFCPNTGGVESHIYYLGQCLLDLGHKVIVVTHAYGKRRGIRYMSNGLKVYYMPFIVFYNGCILPTVYGTLPWIRYIIIRERVDVVHGHSSFSALAHEAMFHAQLMNVSTVFTDHSLFGFADASSILTNKLLQFTLANCGHVICVSHTSKENTVLRSRKPANLVSVIPNALQADMFQPDPSLCNKEFITIVSIGRLVYRKGADLLAGVIPLICAQHPDVRFIIGGDGPKRVLLEETRERYRLQERVTLLGNLPHSRVAPSMLQGQIYLNCSLTEAFCITIIEAASCGLHVVTTKVGGVPEVLPMDLVTLAHPTVAGVQEGLEHAIDLYRRKTIPDPYETHERVKRMYPWPDVAKRTERVYDRVLKMPRSSLRTKLRRFFNCGFIFGLFFSLVAMIDYVFITVLDIAVPAKRFRAAADVPTNVRWRNFSRHPFFRSKINSEFRRRSEG